MPAPPPGRQILLLTIAFEGAMLLLAVAIGYVVGIPFWEHPGTWPQAALGIALSLPLTIAVIVLFETSHGPFTRIREDLTHVITWMRQCSIVDLLVVSLCAGICEEALFRGLLQTWATPYTGPWAAIALTSLLFGLAHALSVPYVFFAGTIGFFLGWLYMATGSLAAPVAFHGGYDFFALVYGIHMRRRRFGG